MENELLEISRNFWKSKKSTPFLPTHSLGILETLEKYHLLFHINSTCVNEILLLEISRNPLLTLPFENLRGSSGL